MTLSKKQYRLVRRHRTGHIPEYYCAIGDRGGLLWDKDEGYAIHLYDKEGAFVLMGRHLLSNTAGEHYEYWLESKPVGEWERKTIEEAWNDA